VQSSQNHIFFLNLTLLSLQQLCLYLANNFSSIICFSKKTGDEVTAVCNVSYISSKEVPSEILPTILVVTPTYSRREQIAELTRFESL